MSLSDSLKSLLEPRAYPHPVRSIELVETHISWILLTGEWAYKIKRPVCYAFVDLRSAQHRAFLCREEVRLNRRFAPELYDGVCAITADGAGVRLDGDGQIIEYAVKMRQFDRRDALDQLLRDGEIEPRMLEEFGRDLARIHSGLPRTPPDQSWGQPPAVRTVILQNLQECAQAAQIFAAAEGIRALREPLESLASAAAGWMAERLAAGRVRECHGDLHCGNVLRRGPKLVAFDCLEFEPRFRWIDVADEIAFLLADQDSLARPAHAQAFLAGYLEESADYGACRFLRLFKAHRSLVRAKVAALSAAGGGTAPTALETARERYTTHVRSARDSLAPKRPALVLMSGLSGSGKTWLAKRLAPRLAAVHLRSDVERKRLAGLGVAESSGSALADGLYTPAATRSIYRHLEKAAEEILLGGITVIIDATFGRREDRARLRNMADRLGVAVSMVICHAPDELLRLRITERTRLRNDASEADAAVLRWQQEHFEPLQDDESIVRYDAVTTDSDVVDRLVRQLAQ